MSATEKKGMVDKQVKTFPPFMNRYEKANLLGIRAKEIANGGKIHLTTEEMAGITSPYYLAVRELELGKIPMAVKRSHANGSVEEWHASELQTTEH